MYKDDFLGLTVVPINDCSDGNARMRVEARLSRLLPGATILTTVPVQNDLEASLNILDALDAVDNPWLHSGSGLLISGLDPILNLIVANVAPRKGVGNHGVGFYYARFGSTLILTTLSGYELSLLKKVGLSAKLYRLDVTEVVKWMVRSGLISKDYAHHIENSQFRSFEFLPITGLCLLKMLDHVPTHPGSWEDLPVLADGLVGTIDVFGNAKLTAVGKAGFKFSLEGEPSRIFESKPNLAALNDREAGVVRGSSGFWQCRLAEFMIKGSAAAKKYGLELGALAVNKVEP